MISRRTVLLPDGESELSLRVLRCLSQVPGLSVCSLSLSALSAADSVFNALGGG